MVRTARVNLYAFAAVAAFGSSMSAHATPVLNTANGHYYDWIETRLTWEEARLDAQSRTFLGVAGDLATVTSKGEQDFLDLFFSDRDGWLGGFQELGSPEPGQGWRWITGEPFIFTFWGDDEPNNIFGDNPNENRIELITGGFGREWNDVPNVFTTAGYFIEFAPASVPEPSAALLLAFGGSLTWLARRVGRK